MSIWNVNIFTINPNDTKFILRQDNGINVDRNHVSFFVYNVGKSQVYVKSLYGTRITTRQTLSARYFQPGECGIVSIPYQLFFITECKVYNETDVITHCHVSRLTGYPSHESAPSDLGFDVYGALKTIALFGVSKIPMVGEVLSVVLGIFWPEEQKEDVWNDIKDKVMNYVNGKIQETIKGILEGDINRMKLRLMAINEDMEDPEIEDSLASHFMNIAEDLIGFEQKFIFSAKTNPDFADINYYLLPMYSALITLKLSYYRFGIKNQEKLHLSKEHVYRLKKYSKKVLYKGAIDHIKKIGQAKLDEQYLHANGNLIFDQFEGVRTFVAMSGEEYIDLWKLFVENPLEEKKPHNTAVSYSPYFGRPTPRQSRMMLLDELSQPFKPKIIDGRLNKIKSIVMFLLLDKTISGMRVKYHNGDKSDTGLSTSSYAEVIVGENYVTKLRAVGDNVVDGLVYLLQNGATFKVGVTKSNTFKLLEREDHYIVGFFMTNDRMDTNQEQACNIAVSFAVISDDM